MPLNVRSKGRARAKQSKILLCARLHNRACMYMRKQKPRTLAEMHINWRYRSRRNGRRRIMNKVGSPSTHNGACTYMRNNVPWAQEDMHNNVRSKRPRACICASLCHVRGQMCKSMSAEKRTRQFPKRSRRRARIITHICSNSVCLHVCMRRCMHTHTHVDARPFTCTSVCVYGTGCSYIAM